MSVSSWIALAAALCAAACCSTVEAGSVRAEQPEGLELKLVTFNVRYGTAADGEDAWPHRADMATGLVGRLDGDVIGLQEALRFQLDAFEAAMPGYAEVGVGRDDGATKGEYAALLVRTSRFAIDASGTFWLSDTPEAVASRSWGNGITRVCTWARLVEKKTGDAVYVFNVHLDHQSQPSRERAAELIAARIGAREHTENPVVLMGDFNAGEANPALQYLRGERERASESQAWPEYTPPQSPALTDTFRAIHPDATEVGTFNGFKAGATNGEKIDHILVSPGAHVLDAGIDRSETDGRYPSDHFAVWASVRF
ncbi:MAG: endonuclease/exonuclease/phosphatase family protein [Phycisphaerales bacterium]|nr:endonuclease/exonuclease/phosphatase family protein [Phycisphaerales bacterium]